MIPEIGHFSLILVFCWVGVQAIIPLLGVYFKKSSWMLIANHSAIAQFIFASISFLTLAYAFVVNDFSVAYVAQNSHSELPLIYRFCAVWGAHEGSLLLWAWILSLWTLCVSIFSKALSLETRATVLSVLGMIAFGFLLFLLSTSNPFLRLLANTPLEGRDLNPLLQDPGLVSHPPMLYMGYVGFAVAFAFAITALLQKRFDGQWARWAQPWTLLAWSFLSLGIVLGSWWAYRELGWGGWWFWDPVENASFLPWLAGTALIHSLAVVAKRDTFKAWAVLLAICTFSLSLVGTFLVRSGVLVSVHAFAVDSSRGSFILAFLAFVIGGSLLLYATRGARLTSPVEFELSSRETLLLSNNVLLIVAMLTVLLGTIYPLFLDALQLEKISIGPAYFNTMMVPIMTPILFLLGMAPILNWKSMPFTQVIKKLRWSFFLAIFLGIILPWGITGHTQWGVILGVSLSFWIIFASVAYILPRATRISLRSVGMYLAHVGVAIVVLGIVLSKAYSIQEEVKMSVGEFIEIGKYQVQLITVKETEGPNYFATQAQVEIKKNGKLINVLFPQQRIYNAQRMLLAKTAIDVGFTYDLYVALGQELDKNTWAMRIYYKPFVRWIWFGGLMIVLGGLLAALSKGLRRGLNA